MYKNEKNSLFGRTLSIYRDILSIAMLSCSCTWEHRNIRSADTNKEIQISKNRKQQEINNQTLIPLLSLSSRSVRLTLKCSHSKCMIENLISLRQSIDNICKFHMKTQHNSHNQKEWDEVM